MSEYRKRLWSQVWQAAVRSHAPVHLYWGFVPLIIAGAVGLFLARKWGAPTFSPISDIGFPLLSGIAGLVVALTVYVIYYRLKAPRMIWEMTQSQLQQAQAQIAALGAEARNKKPHIELLVDEEEPGSLRVKNTGGDAECNAEIRFLSGVFSLPAPPQLSRTYDCQWPQMIVRKGVAAKLRIAEAKPPGGQHTGGPRYDFGWAIYYADRGAAKTAYFTSTSGYGTPGCAVIEIKLSYAPQMDEPIKKRFEICAGIFREILSAQ